jgi:zinc transporter ZupT
MLTFTGLLAGMATVLFIVLLVLVFDSVGGTPLSERVTVTRRKFVPAHLMFVGKSMIPVAKHWTLDVVGENGQGIVQVSERLYNSIHEGDSILVIGKKGRMSGRWYLKKALLM